MPYDPPEVTRQLLELRERLGSFGTLVLVAHDWDDKARWVHSLELFAGVVMPALRTLVSNIPRTHRGVAR